MPGFSSGGTAERSSWTVVADSTANAAVTGTRAGVSGRRLYILGFEAVLFGASAGNDITVEVRDGTTARWRTYIGAGASRGERVGVMFPQPLELTAGNDAVINATAGGTGAQVTVSMMGDTR